MTDQHDPQAQRSSERREFWNEFVIPTAQGLESFAWRAIIGGLLIFLIFRSFCP